jgi:hypothetical protein
MKVTGEVQEIRGDIKRRLMAQVEKQVGPMLEAWGIAAPKKITVRYDFERLAYQARITFGAPDAVHVDWFIDEDGIVPNHVYEGMMEQLAADARIPLMEEEL